MLLYVWIGSEYHEKTLKIPYSASTGSKTSNKVGERSVMSSADGQRDFSSGTFLHHCSGLGYWGKRGYGSVIFLRRQQWRWFRVEEDGNRGVWERGLTPLPLPLLVLSLPPALKPPFCEAGKMNFRGGYQELGELGLGKVWFGSEYQETRLRKDLG